MQSRLDAQKTGLCTARKMLRVALAGALACAATAAPVAKWHVVNVSPARVLPAPPRPAARPFPNRAASSSDQHVLGRACVLPRDLFPVPASVPATPHLLPTVRCSHDVESRLVTVRRTWMRCRTRPRPRCSRTRTHRPRPTPAGRRAWRPRHRPRCGCGAPRARCDPTSARVAMCMRSSSTDRRGLRARAALLLHDAHVHEARQRAERNRVRMRRERAVVQERRAAPACAPAQALAAAPAAGPGAPAAAAEADTRAEHERQVPAQRDGDVKHEQVPGLSRLPRRCRVL